MTDETLTTRERMLALLAQEPTLSQSELSRRLGVSRERVRQIAATEGIALARAPYPASVQQSPPKPRVITGGVPVQISASAAGTIGELLVAADLMARGWTVFYPFSRTTTCDLLALTRDGMRVERIEVRCGHRREDGRISWQRPDTSKSDRRAVVITGEPVRYSPPFPGDG